MYDMYLKKLPIFILTLLVAIPSSFRLPSMFRQNWVELFHAWATPLHYDGIVARINAYELILQQKTHKWWRVYFYCYSIVLRSREYNSMELGR